MKIKPGQKYKHELENVCVNDNCFDAWVSISVINKYKADNVRKEFADQMHEEFELEISTPKAYREGLETETGPVGITIRLDRESLAALQSTLGVIDLTHEIPTTKRKLIEE